jgi:RNA polymerase sigma-70 factor (sigma-E family)
VGATDEVGADRGDRYSALYAEHAPRALRFAFLLTGERELAEDLVQDAFIKVMGRFGDLRREEAFATYLRKTIVNLSYGTFRRRRVERQYLSRERRYSGASAPTSGPDLDRDDELWSRLEQLPPRQRVALVLRYYEDLSEKQTAAAMGCSLRTVKSLVNRGLVALRAQEAFHE